MKKVIDLLPKIVKTHSIMFSFRKINLFILVAASMLLFNSCTLLDLLTADSPEIKKLNSIRISNIGILDFDMIVDMDMYNPNNLNLTINKLIYNVEINGTVIGHGSQNSISNLPRNENINFSTSINIKYSDLIVNGINLLNAIYNKETLYYRIVGKTNVYVLETNKSYNLDIDIENNFKALF